MQGCLGLAWFTLNFEIGCQGYIYIQLVQSDDFIILCNGFISVAQIAMIDRYIGQDIVRWWLQFDYKTLFLTYTT